MSRLLLLFVPFLLVSCAEPQWYAHPCGNSDPVGISCVDEADTLWEEPSGDLCSDLGVADGDPCDEDGAACVSTPAFTCTSLGDGQRSNEYFLTCRNAPYDDQICPTSSRSVKRDIQYIESGERKQLASEVLNVKLARYHYRDSNKPGLRLGYILEDQPKASFSGEGRVDLYAYVSAVVALAQEQQADIDRLKAEIEDLKKQSD